MHWHPFAISLVVGLGIGAIYGLLTVRSPAPPIIALLGLLGILAGEAAVQWLKGHPDTLSRVFHAKSFHIAQRDAEEKPQDKTTL